MENRCRKTIYLIGFHYNRVVSLRHIYCCRDPFTPILPGIQFCYAINYQANTIITKKVKLIITRIEVNSPCPTSGKMIRQYHWIRSVILPIKIYFRIISHDRRVSTESLVVVIFSFPPVNNRRLPPQSHICSAAAVKHLQTDNMRASW